jgi:hypothetical protein
MLARQIAKVDRVNLDDARSLAAADVDLERIQRVKTALIDRMHVFGAFDPPFLFHSTTQEVRWIRMMLLGRVPGFPEPPNPSANATNAGACPHHRSHRSRAPGIVEIGRLRETCNRSTRSSNPSDREQPSPLDLTSKTLTSAY